MIDHDNNNLNGNNANNNNGGGIPCYNNLRRLVHIVKPPKILGK